MSGNNDIDIHLRGHADGLKPAASEAKDTIRDLKDDVVSKTSEMTGASRGLVEMLAKLPLPLVAAGAAAAGMAKAYADGAEEMKKMNLAIALGGNISGQTAGSLRALAEETASYSQLTIAESKEMASVLAGSGQIGAAAFRNITLMAGDFARVMGTDVKAVGPELVKLFDDPAKGAEELNRRMHFLSTTQLDHIAHLQRMGEVTQAQTELSRLLGARLEEIAPKLGTLEKAWNNVQKSASGAWDAMMGIGRDKTDKDRLDFIVGQIAELGDNPLLARGREKLMQEARELERKVNAQAAKGQDDSDAAEQNRREQRSRELSKSTREAQIRDIDDQITFQRSMIGKVAFAAENVRDLEKKKADLQSAKGSKAEKTPLEKMVELGERNLRESKAKEYQSVDDDEEARLGAPKRNMESLRREAQEARTEFEALQRMVKKGEENELALYYETAGEETMRLVAHQRELKDAGKDTFSELTRAVESWGSKAADTFADFVVDGKASFSDLVTSMLKDIVRLQAKSYLDPITKGAGNWLTSAIGNMLGIGGGGADVQLAAGGVMSGPGISAFSGSVVSRPTVFPFAHGIGLMGEAGEEAIIPLKRAADGKLGVQSSGGGGVQVIVNDQRSASSAAPVGVEQSRNGDGMQQIRILIRDEVRGLVGNGQLDASMRASYGVQRSLTKRS